MAKDPFTLVFDALWDLAEASTPLCNAVRVGNRIKYNLPQERDPEKSAIEDADLPELILLPSGIATANYTFNSCDAMIQRTYSWLLSTGDLRVSYRLFPVQWALFCAMADWSNILSQITWNGNTNFIKNFSMPTLGEGLLTPEQNRNIRGWSSVWTCTVDFYLPLQAIRDFNQS